MSDQKREPGHGTWPTITGPQDAVRLLCRLQHEVSERFLDHRFACDCFCKEGGSWCEAYDPEKAGTWRNSGRALAFIWGATMRALAQHRWDVAENNSYPVEENEDSPW